MPEPTTENPGATVPLLSARQKKILLALASVLLLAGFVVLFALRRITLPMRLAMSFGDFVAAAALLLMLRQKSSGPG